MHGAIPKRRVSSRPSMWRRSVHRVQRSLPFVVWVGAIAAVFWLGEHDDRGLRTSGFARVVARDVTPVGAGRIAHLAVTLDESVEKGQVLALLDGTSLRLSLAAAEFDLARLQAELAREIASNRDRVRQRRFDYDAQLRRFFADRDQVHIDVLQLNATIERDKVRREAIELELNRLRAVERGVVAESRLEDKEIEHREMVTRIKENRKVLVRLEDHHRRAIGRVEDFRLQHQGEEEAAHHVGIAPLELAISAQETRLEALGLQAADLEVRAPISGRVAALLRGQGDVVTPGDPILSLVDHEPREIVVHVPEDQWLSVTPGDAAVLTRRANPSEKFESVVLRTGAMIASQPSRVDPMAHSPGFGVPVYVSCPPGRQIMPGEAFSVVLTGRPSSRLPLVQSAAQALDRTND